MSQTLETDQVGATSEESAPATPPKRLEFGLFDLASLFALLFVTVATLMMFIELQGYGNVFRFSWPWSVSTARATPVSTK